MYPDMDGSAVGAGAAAGSIFGPVGTVGGALLGAGLGFAGDLIGLRAQKELQKKTWQREDTAVQRRVADLRAAGLSPTLAAGSAAGSSAPINVMGAFSNMGDRGGAAIEGAFELAAKRIGLRKLDAEAGQSEADRERAWAEARLAKERATYAQRLAWYEAQGKGFGVERTMWGAHRENQEAWIAEYRQQLMRDYGYTADVADAKARVLAAQARNVDSNVRIKQGEAGAGLAGQAGMWADVIGKLLDLIRR